jgi:hypothetical protein
MRGHGLLVSSILFAASSSFAGSGFAPASTWSIHYSDTQGWSSDPAYWRTVRLADVNGDNKADVCGRGIDGVTCSLSTGSGFASPSLWTSGFRDSYGWNASEAYWGTIQFPDVNGDGKADVCGRGVAGVHCELSTGNSFDPSNNLWTGGFSNYYGWNASKSYWGTIQFPDVNGDGKADVCGRDSYGVHCELSTGSSFDPSNNLWSTTFSDFEGWSANESYWGTIQFPDVNGDGKADVCARTSGGVRCELSTGTRFVPSTGLWTWEFSNAKAWNTDAAYWKTIRFPDVNGDGKADVCGRGEYGILCALSTGTSFGPGVWWTDGFRDSSGWISNPAYWQTVRFPDVNGDGKADACGRGAFGVHCLLSTGSAFVGDGVPSYDYTDAQGWAVSPSYWQTLQFQDLNADGKADICGRGIHGLVCALTQ